MIFKSEIEQLYRGSLDDVIEYIKDTFDIELNSYESNFYPSDEIHFYRVDLDSRLVILADLGIQTSIKEGDLSDPLVFFDINTLRWDCVENRAIKEIKLALDRDGYVKFRIPYINYKESLKYEVLDNLKAGKTLLKDYYVDIVYYVAIKKYFDQLGYYTIFDYPQMHYSQNIYVIDKSRIYIDHEIEDLITIQNNKFFTTVKVNRNFIERHKYIIKNYKNYEDTFKYSKKDKFFVKFDIKDGNIFLKIV